MTRTGFDAQKIVEALAKKGIKCQTEPTPNKAFVMGEIHHKSGKDPMYPSNHYYMDGYNSYEPVFIVKRVGNKRPQYSVCDADYHENLPEFSGSQSDALKFAYMSTCGLPISIMLYKDMSFNAQVAHDAAIKPDVARLYQSTIDGKLSTSVDGGKAWFDGGVMGYPKIPVIQFQYEWAANTSYRRWETRSRRANESELMKGSLTKLKPPKPQPPPFFDETDWWETHLKISTRASHQLDNIYFANGVFKIIHNDETARLERIAQCQFDYKYSDATKKENPDYHPYKENERYYHLKEWRCACFYKRLAEYEKQQLNYQQALEKWEQL